MSRDLPQHQLLIKSCGGYQGLGAREWSPGAPPCVSMVSSLILSHLARLLMQGGIALRTKTRKDLSTEQFNFILRSRIKTTVDPNFVGTKDGFTVYGVDAYVAHAVDAGFILGVRLGGHMLWSDGTFSEVWSSEALSQKTVKDLPSWDGSSTLDSWRSDSNTLQGASV